ncbi:MULTISPECIES: hypothetical protein [Cellvibrionaceae]|uniref:Uncharacterized protein n=1 Tax=Saccharophagus degradans TaxID=86304 RepID=A0AAW7X312_9GAMM|nr:MULTISPECIES: hypothetical protein [Cellvibrionaceae]MDO6421343.1 hypothetical protein [Saccharophagus degradans]MDO6605746.1 hypothetical protein [Saccharophagus degradans]
MDYLVKDLVSTDKLYEWGAVCSEVKGKERSKAYNLAVPLWLERMVNEGKILLNPAIIKELKSLNWRPTDLHKKMIWASIVCKLDAKVQKEEKARIRTLIQKKYGNDWWEEVYSRAGKVWPAWDRYRKNVLSMGPGAQMLAMHSTVFGEAMLHELDSVLNMVPKT